jgi:hypothetical protein
VIPFSPLQSNTLNDSAISFSLVIVNIILQWFVSIPRHESQKFTLIDKTIAIRINLANELVDLLLRRNTCHLSNKRLNLLRLSHDTCLVRLPSLSLSKSLKACLIYFIWSLLNWFVI